MTQRTNGEMTIPNPLMQTNWEDLPMADVIRPLTGFDGGMTYDASNHRLFLNERGAGVAEQNANIVHVWQVQ